GWVLSRNPLFPGKVTRYALTPECVDGVIFCSKNYRPILPHIAGIAKRFNIYCHYTITAYGKDIEPGVPAIDESMASLEELSRIVGRGRVAWRYDPVLLTKDYTVERHCDTFARMAERLAPHVDRCIFSFVEMYAKLVFNMPEIIPFSLPQMDALAKEFGAVAQRHGLHLQTCGTNGDYSRYGIHPSACMTLTMLGRANGVEFRQLKHRGMRHGCHCMESRDIGAYDTCMNGCKYCYANTNPRRAFENYKEHDPDSPLLLGHLREGDVVVQGVQKSYLKGNARAAKALSLV
nr:DUF1848 domain-containing protein [Desulfovibrio sp.]